MRLLTPAFPNRLRGAHGLLLMVAGAAACAKQPPPAQANVPVSVVLAERRAVSYTIAATGTVEPIATVEVTSQVGCILQPVHFHEGEDVQQGQVLFEIDARPYQAARQQSEANLSRTSDGITSMYSHTRSSSPRAADFDPS